MKNYLFIQLQVWISAKFYSIKKDIIIYLIELYLSLFDIRKLLCQKIYYLMHIIEQCYAVMVINHENCTFKK